LFRFAGLSMIDCLNAARYFIVRAYEDGIEAEMTNMKVQKLLYYSQSLNLALYNEPLFDEQIQAWRYGPVCPPAYRFYSEFFVELVAEVLEGLINDQYPINSRHEPLPAKIQLPEGWRFHKLELRVGKGANSCSFLN
jgi:Protein of unknown function (DUF4065)